MNSSPDCSPKSAEDRQPGGTPKAVTDDTQIIKSRPAATLVGIVLFKLGKGILFLGVALALYALSDNNLPEEFLAIVEKLHLNPETKLAANILRQLGRITEANQCIHKLTVNFAGLPRRDLAKPAHGTNYVGARPPPWAGRTELAGAVDCRSSAMESQATGARVV
jgi:hypothetical protein